MKDTLTPFLSQAESPSTGRLRRSLFVGLFLALVTLALVVPPAAVGDGAAADEWPWEVQPGEDSDVFPLVGELTFRDEDGEKDSSFHLVGVDPTLHLAVFSNIDWHPVIRLVDTRTLEQLDVIDLDDHLPENVRMYGRESAKQMEVDTEHHRLIIPAEIGPTGRRIRDMVGTDDACGAHDEQGAPSGTVRTLCGASVPAAEFPRPAMITVSLIGEHDPVATPLDVDLEPEEETLDTAIVNKIAYHAPTDKVYAVTESVPPEHTDNQTGNPYTTLHEFDSADLLGEEGAEATWSHQLNSCDIAASLEGGFLARSLRADFVYLPCLGSDTGMHGVVVLDLNPGSDPSDTSQFEERFHPFAADLGLGFATGDATNDMILFSNSASERHRLFTFDAYHEAWTGASALNDDTGNVLAARSNPETGRIYQFKQGTNLFASGELRVTEGDRVVVPNGDDYDLGHVKVTSLHLPGFDPSTRRLFLKQVRMCLEWADDGSCETPEPDDSMPHFRVFEDRLPDASRPEPYDFDQDTEDVSDVDGPVFSSAASNATAFGARYLFVGGTQSSRPADKQEVRKFFVEDSPLGPSARDVVRAEVDEASLTRFTGTPTVVASAVGLTFGEQIGSDIKSNTAVRCATTDVTGECLPNDWQNEEPNEQERELYRFFNGRNWPEDFPEDMRGDEAYCDDFGGEPAEDARAGAAVSCDSLEPVGQAGALYTATDEQAPVQVGYAETSVEVREDEASGSVATATAVARDIDLFGQISIGEIRTEATAVAHGRPGTAATELTREYRQVRVGDFACGWGEDDPCDIWEVARAINEVMQPRLVASVPAQDTTLNPDASDEPDDQPGEARVSNGTPGGAKAGVTLDPYDARSNETINEDERTELPGLQIVYYDDHDAVSRHIFQFAAVELDTYYIVNAAPTFDPPDWADGGGGFGGDDGFGDGVGGAAARGVTPPSVVALGEEPVTPADEPDVSSRAPTGDAGGFGADGGTSGLEQGRAPSLGTAEGPALDTGEGASAPAVAPDASSGGQPVAQGGQAGSSGPGGLVLTRQRVGETVPLAVLWVLGALPLYLAVRRRRLLASSAR